jgi:rod shape determining protein RodA
MGIVLRSQWFRSFDWVLFGSAILLSCAGLVTMNSFVGESYFFEKQIVVLAISVCACLFLSFLDFRFLKKTQIVVGLYVAVIALLSFLLITGQVIKGAKGWLNLGFFHSSRLNLQN